MAEKETLKEALRRRDGTFLVFETTHLTMKAESLLTEAGIPLRLFPKPQRVISECGIVIKVLEEDLERIRELFKEQGLHIKEVLTIAPGK